MVTTTTTTEIPDDLASMTTSQRALIGARLHAELAEAGKERRRTDAASRRQADGSFGSAPRQPDPRSRQSAVIAARRVGVGKSSIRAAARLIRDAPDLVELVAAGSLTIGEADQEVRRRHRRTLAQARAAHSEATAATTVTVIGSHDDLIGWLWPPPPLLKNVPPVTGSNTENVAMPETLRKALAAYSLAALHVLGAEDDFRSCLPHVGMLWASCIVRGDPAAAAAVSGTLNERHARWRALAVEARHRFDEAAVVARRPKTREALQRAVQSRLEALDQHLRGIAASPVDYRDDRHQLAVDRARAETLRRDLDRAEALLRWADWAAGQRTEDPLPPRQSGSGPVVWPIGRLSQRAMTGLSRLWPPTPTGRY